MKGIKPSDMLTRLKAKFGDATLSQNRVFTWARQFKGCRESVEHKKSWLTPKFKTHRWQHPYHSKSYRRWSPAYCWLNTLWNPWPPSLQPRFIPCDYFFVFAHERIAWRRTIQKQRWCRGVCAQLVDDAPSNFFEQGMFKLPNRWQ